jgi:hypothetical protein
MILEPLMSGLTICPIHGLIRYTPYGWIVIDPEEEEETKEETSK